MINCQTENYDKILFLREEISHHSSFFISTHAEWLLMNFPCILIHQGLTLLYSFNKKIETITIRDEKWPKAPRACNVHQQIEVWSWLRMSTTPYNYTSISWHNILMNSEFYFLNFLELFSLLFCVKPRQAMGGIPIYIVAQM